MIYDFAVIGGDMRQVYLANYLKIKDIRLSHMQPKKKAQNARKVNLLKMS